MAFDSIDLQSFDLIDSIQLIVDSIDCYSLTANHLIEVNEPYLNVDWFEGSISVSNTVSLNSSYAGNIRVLVENMNGETELVQDILDRVNA